MKIFKILSILYLIFISIGLLIPLNHEVVIQIVEKEKQPNNNISFLIHFILFFILYILFYAAFTKKHKVLIFCICYAVFIEVLQIFFSRGFQVLDIIFNFIGIFISFILLFFFTKDSCKYFYF